MNTGGSGGHCSWVTQLDTGSVCKGKPVRVWPQGPSPGAAAEGVRPSSRLFWKCSGLPPRTVDQKVNLCTQYQ